MSNERGSMTVAMMGVVAVVIVLGVAVAAIATLYAAKTQAETAADAAALAAAVGTYPPAASGAPVSSAQGIAVANGAVLIGCECPVDPGLTPRTVLVSVAVDAAVPLFDQVRVRASARAEFDPLGWLGR